MLGIRPISLEWIDVESVSLYTRKGKLNDPNCYRRILPSLIDKLYTPLGTLTG